MGWRGMFCKYNVIRSVGTRELVSGGMTRGLHGMERDAL